MRKISFFRHAKSDWSDPEKGDFDRPLNSRGQQAAPLMGAFMAEEKICPDIVLCSTAVRARETLDLMVDSFSSQPEIIHDDKLYMADARTMLDRVHKLSDAGLHVMIIGHNPGMHIMALALIEMAQDEDYLNIVEKFPTAGLAVVEFNCDKWSEVLPGRGQLKHFMTPKALV